MFLRYEVHCVLTAVYIIDFDFEDFIKHIKIPSIYNQNNKTLK